MSQEAVGAKVGALEHLGVIDLADLRGALAGRLLADLGADVVKIEPRSGDPDRQRPLPFLFRNAGKRGAVIDLESKPGRERLERLCEQAESSR
jgi:crotonobetainyl-CoA:carnitine CoA-transferase CaiB-like acyl-CoA transferase